MNKKPLETHIDELSKEDFFIFVLEKWRISSGEHLNEKYSLAERPYMLEVIQDDFEFQATLKAAQAGLSEIEVARAIFECGFQKRNVLYTMPAGEQMQQFVDARARNAIINNEYLSNLVTGTLNLKKFSLSHHQLYFRGVQKRRQIISVDVSTLFADECDEYEEGILNTLDKRLGASRSPRRHYFSTPSFHGTGISLYYYGSDAYGEKGSDQRVWTIKCQHCEKFNEDLLWPENILDLNDRDNKFSSYQPNVIVICRFCHKPLNRLSSGEWVAKLPSNSGYCHGRHISKLFSPVSDLNQMYLDSKNPIKEQEFWNSDLGLPYEPKGSKLTDESIDKVRGQYTIWMKSDIKMDVGVDTGAKIHVTVGHQDENGRIKVVTALELDDFIELDLLYKDFKIRTMVMDMNPDKDEKIKFQDSHENVWLAYYAQHLELKKESFTKNFDDMVLAVNRTLMMMTVSDLITRGQMTFPYDIRRVRDFYNHLKAPIKAQKQDIRGDWVTFYPKTKLPDHFYHSLLYLILSQHAKPRPVIFKIVKTMMS